MQLEAAFRRSLYLSLAIASLALCVAEGEYIPETPIVGCLVGALLLVAYFLEGRWSLTLSAANSVGMVLTAILGIWVTYQFFRPVGGSLIDHLPWPTRLLPYLGPVILILIPVKLFRPKEIGDYWTMYGLGLMSMALGCAMDEDGLFSLLLVVWLVIFVWSLTLFYLYRESGLQPILSMSDRPEAARHSGRFPLLSRAARWGFGAMAVAFFCFTATPRISGKGLFTLRSSMETGISTDSQIDLNHTGLLNVNEEVAFTVQAEDAEGNPKTDLPLDTRWRNAAMSNYAKGKWFKDRFEANILLDNAVRPLPYINDNPSRNARQNASPRDQRLPNLGPNQFFLTFRPAPEQPPIPLVMDPPFWKRDELPPIVSMVKAQPEEWMNWQHSNDTSFKPSLASIRLRDGWCETRVPPAEPDLGPTMYLATPVRKSYLDYTAVEKLSEWTDQVVEKLIAQGKLSPKVRERGIGEGKRKRVYHEAIARELCAYMANSGEFEYTLDLRIKDRLLDPVEDFLYNVRAGHCQRFATALVFMLRTQGIPAQFVLGYKGCEQVSPGSYVIRQSHAHTWVEVLIPRPALPEDPVPASMDPESTIHYHWLVLDPTPDLFGGEATTSTASWFEAAQNRTSEFFRNVILGFNNDLRDKVGRYFSSFLTRAGESAARGELSHEIVVLMILFGAMGVRLVVLRFRRRGEPIEKCNPTVDMLTRLAPFHLRLMTILERAGFRPVLSQTAREFTDSVSAELTRAVETNEVASIPREANEQYYRVRFGNETLSSEEIRTLDVALDQLEGRLRLLAVQPVSR